MKSYIAEDNKLERCKFFLPMQFCFPCACASSSFICVYLRTLHSPSCRSGTDEQYSEKQSLLEDIRTRYEKLEDCKVNCFLVTWQHHASFLLVVQKMNSNTKGSDNTLKLEAMNSLMPIVEQPLASLWMTDTSKCTIYKAPLGSGQPFP